MLKTHVDLLSVVCLVHKSDQLGLLDLCPGFVQIALAAVASLEARQQTGSKPLTGACIVVQDL